MTTRRSFLASIAAALVGRRLTKPKAQVSNAPPSTVVHFVGRGFHHSYAWVPGDGSLFNPRENVHAQWLQAQHNMRLDLQLDAMKNRWNPPAPWVFRV